MEAWAEVNLEWDHQHLTDPVLSATTAKIQATGPVNAPSLVSVVAATSAAGVAVVVAAMVEEAMVVAVDTVVATTEQLVAIL